ncbi:MAG: hypothetical protein CVU39_07400 [Chloroflexi bacterium HGW-Chloroflexi-10]|nr:MAG: hypothetical protein CVU39_07400 [Chloroflexi bacterium HGW-Chloroflexi-10]
MKNFQIFVVLIIAIFILTACTGQDSISDPTTVPSTLVQPPQDRPTQTQPTQVQPTDFPIQETETLSGLMKSDAQGFITVDITPEILDNPEDVLVFDVALNTHSIDLSMDLAQHAILSTDTGKTVQAILWDAPRGGHHVDGKLSFPSVLDGNNLLIGAMSITITIVNLDAPSRIFTWQLENEFGG